MAKEGLIHIENVSLENINKKGEYLDSLTIADIVKIEPDNFIQHKAKNPKKALVVVKLMIAELVEDFKGRETLSEREMDKLASYILNSYDILSIEDLHLIFNGIIYNPHTENYGILSQQFIIGAIDSYLDRKEVEERAYREKIASEQREKVQKTLEINKDIDQVFKEIREKIEKKEEKVVTFKQTKSPLEKLIEDSVHYILACDNTDLKKVMDRFEIPDFLARELINTLTKYKIREKIYHHDIYFEFNEKNEDPLRKKFKKVCFNILKYWEDE